MTSPHDPAPLHDSDFAAADRLKRTVERNRRFYMHLLKGASGWDHLILTASDEDQAESYREELQERSDRGLLPPDLALSVIADPPGERVGSGGATFHVLRERPPQPGERRLILHCGGESRRLPAYGPMGKLFAPLPCKRADGCASTVFDEILVSLAPVVSRMQPGCLVASADVLLLFQATRFAARTESGVTGLGFATDARTAQEHGIYVSGRKGNVTRFLQKPTMQELWDAGALRADGTALVDTGVFLFPEALLHRLSDLSQSQAGHLPSDLYLDWALPMVPSQERAAYLASGDARVREPLWNLLHGVPFSVRVADPSRFVHLGTTAQWRDALLNDPITAYAMGFEASFRSFCESGPPPGACLLHSCISSESTPELSSPAVSPGEKNRIEPGVVVESCRLAGNFHLGEGSVAVGVVDLSGTLQIPSGYAVDQLPVRSDAGYSAWVTRVYPVQMDPKATGNAMELFGRTAQAGLNEFGLVPGDLWPDVGEDPILGKKNPPGLTKNERESGGNEGDAPLATFSRASSKSTSALASASLWNANLFPVAPSQQESLELAQWLLQCAYEGQGSVSNLTGNAFQQWLKSPRISFEACRSQVDRPRLREARAQREIEAQIARVRHALREDEDARRLLLAHHDFAPLEAALSEELDGTRGALRAARANWLLADLLRTLQRASSSRYLAEMKSASRSVAALKSPSQYEAAAFREICRAVDRGVPSLPDSPRLALSGDEEARAAAPVRLDFAGGWSDTPPYSLEHGGAVLNVAVLLDDQRPLRAWVRPLKEPRLRFRALDLGVELESHRLSEILNYTNPRDPFALHKAAVVLMKIVTPEGGTLHRQLERFGGGLELVTESGVPKGSGLGTSSILGGAVLAALGRAMGVILDTEALFHLVLALEQRLTTGGGWQDQVGGLAGGWKITRTEPGFRQEPHIERLELAPDVQAALKDRAFLMYSGYTRLARNILRNMVGQYLSRNARTLEVLHGMRPLVHHMGACLRAGDLNAMGRAMNDTNAAIAAIDPESWPRHLAQIADSAEAHLAGAKPAGAGGGGFLMFLAKSAEDRQRAETILNGLDLPSGARTYPFEVAEEGLQVSVSKRKD